MCMIFISIYTHILTQTHTETEKTLVVASVCSDMHGLLDQLIDPCMQERPDDVHRGGEDLANIPTRNTSIHPITVYYHPHVKIFYVYYVNTTHINRIYLV